MLVLLQFLPFLLLVLLANYGERDRAVRIVTYILLALIDAACVVGGVVFAAAHFLQPYLNVPDFIFPDLNLLGMALMLFIVGALGLLVLLPAVRRALARATRTNPDSPVQTTAFSLAIYYVGLSIGQVLLLGGLEGLALLPLEATTVDLLLSGLALALFGIFGVGYPIRRRGGETLQRLGLRRPTLRQLGFAAGAVVGFLLLDYGVANAWYALNPAQYELIGRVSRGLFGDIDIWKAAAIGLSAGIGEEVLFRGAVQPRFGLWLTALLFAAGHTQYGLSPAIVEVLVIGVLLGVIRNRTNTTTCILIHALYNFTNVMLIPLFP